MALASLIGRVPVSWPLATLNSLTVSPMMTARVWLSGVKARKELQAALVSMSVLGSVC